MIKLDNVSKSFSINNQHFGLLGFIVNKIKKNNSNFKVIKNINLELKDKEVVGLIGRNASGKTTLLKIIAGIISPNEGRVECASKPVYLSGFSNGLNKNLTMLDNIFIIGTLNGLSNNEIKERLNDILEFSELSDFSDVPLYKFSSGMFSRFAFSSMIFTLPSSPDILLLDEVLSVGSDDYFREKIEKKIKEYVDSAKIVIIVNHNSNYILNNCSKIIWLESGEIKSIGGREVVTEYQQSLK